MKDRESQTEERTVKIQLALSNVSVYAQQWDENLSVMARIERVSINELASERGGEILVRMRQLAGDPECRDGLVDVLLDGLKLDAYLFNVLALAELVDDDDDQAIVVAASGKKKESMPANITIKSCSFKLSDDPYYERIEDDPRLLPVSIDRLDLRKLSNGAICIRENSPAHESTHDFTRPRNGALLHHPLGIQKELDFLKQFKYDLTFIEFNSKFKFNSNKFASLVHLLREAKQANARLEDERARMRGRIEAVEAENKRLRDELEEERRRHQDATKAVATAEREEYLESAMKAIAQENETIRRELESTKETIDLLNIEREQYLKLLNEK